MSILHFLNVKQGDCIIIEHASGRITMFDICCGNLPSERLRELLVEKAERERIRGNFRMCEHPTNPISYLEKLTSGPIWRFIPSHPEMDHLDGFNALMDRFGTHNFWRTGVMRPKPDFEGSPYSEADWNRYRRVRDGNEPTVTVLTPRAGSTFQFANRPEGGHDGLYIVAPNDALVQQANETEKWNDGGFVLLYRSPGGKILIPGDAQDATWDYILANHAEQIRDCKLLIAPHHGRKAGQSFKFLDVVQPKLTLFGCAPSDLLAYDAFRDYPFITNNQAGCVVAELGNGVMEVYVENEAFARRVLNGAPTQTNKQGFFLIATI